MPWLKRVVVLPGYHVYTYSFLALLSSVGGGLALAWAVWQLPRQPASPPPPAAARWRYWGAVALVAAGALGGWVAAVQPSWPRATIGAVSAGLLGVLVVSAGWQLARWLLGKLKPTLQ